MDGIPWPAGGKARTLDDKTAFGRLAYLYVGSSDTDRDVAWYGAVLGAQRVWQFRAFGANVAALRVGEGPLWLLADHRPAGHVLPVWEVDDLEATVANMVERGGKPEGEPFEVPDGPCRLFKDPSGNELCLLQVVRPRAMEAAYVDPDNPTAVRGPVDRQP